MAAYEDTNPDAVPTYIMADPNDPDYPEPQLFTSTKQIHTNAQSILS